MSIEFLAELETKVEQLIGAFNAKKIDIDKLNQELQNKNNHISELEGQIQTLRTDFSSIQSSNDDRQMKLDLAAEKIQEMLKKLDFAS